ncbi:MAG: hypothetical protein MZV64_13865 [Ignavibacteriales bacterium]|nr:hypothetical protein [Ignavibacteriales bacterium]
MVLAHPRGRRARAGRAARPAPRWPANAGWASASSRWSSAASSSSCWRCARLWPALHNVDANPFEALVRSPLDALVLGVLVDARRRR